MTLLICGAGQYGFAAKEIAEAMGAFTRIIFLDDNSDIAAGKLCDLGKTEYDKMAVAIGNPDIRRNLLEKTDRPATLIHPQAFISPSAKIGEGSIIEAGAVISSNSEIGRGTIVMANAVVGHDARVGNFCQLKYNSTVTERAILADNTKIDPNNVI